MPIRLVKLGPYAFPHPTWSPDRHEIAFADSKGKSIVEPSRAFARSTCG